MHIDVHQNKAPGVSTKTSSRPLMLMVECDLVSATADLAGITGESGHILYCIFDLSGGMSYAGVCIYGNCA